MAAPTHLEKVRDKVVERWPERVKARAAMRQRALGFDEVSDERARKLWWQENDPMLVARTVAEQGLTGWEATKVKYPQRAMLLDAAKNRGGVKEAIRFTKVMSRQPKEEEAPSDVSRSY